MQANNFISNDKTIYVLHPRESQSHYDGLKYYSESINYKFQYNEFLWFFQILSGAKSLNRNKRFFRGFANFFFLVKLLFLRGRIIVLGIAPYDYRMIFFNFLAKRNHIFYHTSWPYWDQSNFPESKYHKRFKQTIMNAWNNFLETNCKGIFCVSMFTQRNITTNYNIATDTSIVYHSIDRKSFFSENLNKSTGSLKFLFVGRLIESKGIRNLLRLASALLDTDFRLTIVGGGDLSSLIEGESNNLSNIKVYGKLQRSEIANLYREHDFLLCPSKRGKDGWEELFGMAIVEAMSCGCVPIATDHVGPKEIITDKVNGFLLKEQSLDQDMITLVSSLMKTSKTSIRVLKENAILKGQQFYADQIALRWASVLNKYIS